MSVENRLGCGWCGPGWYRSLGAGKDGITTRFSEIGGAAGGWRHERSDTPAIERAYATDPEPGSTYLDAEHVVILMQESRSFDHTYGTLRGVRGYNDPRAITLDELPSQIGNLLFLTGIRKAG